MAYVKKTVINDLLALIAPNHISLRESNALAKEHGNDAFCAFYRQLECHTSTKRIQTAKRRAKQLIGKQTYVLLKQHRKKVKIIDSTHVKLGRMKVRTSRPAVYHATWTLLHGTDKLMPESAVTEPETFHKTLSNLWSTDNLTEVATEINNAVAALLPQA
jgi:hypothetical protein